MKPIVITKKAKNLYIVNGMRILAANVQAALQRYLNVTMGAGNVITAGDLYEV